MTTHQSILYVAVFAMGWLSLYGCQPPEAIPLKVMTYNIRHGEGNDTILDLSRSARIIKAQAPDLCGLQEIDHFCTRTDSIGQTAHLAEATQLEGTFGQFMDYQGGAYGMATLLAKPIVSTHLLRLPDGKYEPRSSIVHEVQLAERCTILFANVHFDWIAGEEGSANRLQQAKALVEYIDEVGRACIIVGDFNCTPDSPTMQYFAEQGFSFVDKGEDNLSFQGERKAEIDHVIYRNSGRVVFAASKVQLLAEPVVSDHRPLVVELEVKMR